MINDVIGGAAEGVEGPDCPPLAGACREALAGAERGVALSKQSIRTNGVFS